MSPNMYAKVIKRPEPDTLPPDHLPGVGEATIPDKLRKIAANCRLQGFLKTADALDAAADEWEKDREQLDAMTVCRDHWEVSYKDVRKRLEADREAYRQLTAILSTFWRFLTPHAKEVLGEYAALVAKEESNG